MADLLDPGEADREEQDVRDPDDRGADAVRQERREGEGEGGIGRRPKAYDDEADAEGREGARAARLHPS